MNKVEYLILMKQKDSFCDSSATFLKLLQVDSSIKIEEDSIIYQNNKVVTKAKFKLKTGEIATKKERYFHLEFINETDENLDNFSNLNQQIKKTLKRITPDETKINTLWDDIGRQYAINAYPLINEIENLMRKLISQFMLINVGMDWSVQEIHDEIKEKIQRYEQHEQYVDDLYKTDFIHLSDVLFTKYRTLDLDEMHRILSKAKTNDDLDLINLKKFIPQSNWEKHFSSQINYDDRKLQEKWKLLYSLRNHVAHNRYITKEDYYKINGLVKELKIIITASIDKLDEINLREEEKEDVIHAYEPNKPLGIMGQLASKFETAVVNWYFLNHRIRNFRENMSTINGYDFSLDLVDSEMSIAVEVLYINPAFSMDVIKSRIFKRIQLGNNLLNQFHEFHMVIVIPQSISDSVLDSIMNLIVHHNTKIKIINGYLDGNGNFVQR
ncbi:hypothetical protein [Paenibacillus sp. MMO-58]|uniref:hypothetical protein n=1 Tax=Paenibacillus sp. MMO-58 TaxID=3081290 RepID=UPI00301780B7